MSQAFLTSSLEDLIYNIQLGKVIAIPTDTVFGLVCSQHSPQAKTQLYQMKKRSKSKILAVYVNTLEEIEKMIHRPLSSQELRVAKTFLPGPLSLILHNKHPEFSESTLTFRIVNHPVVQELISVCGPLVGTSANIADFPPAVYAHEVLEDFKTEDLCIFDGDCFLGLESTVASVDPFILYREGVISCVSIESCLEAVVMRFRTTNHSFAKNIKIYTFLNTDELSYFLESSKNHEFVCKSPHPKTFFSQLRQAISSNCSSICYVYNPETTLYPELSPYLSPYLVNVPAGSL